MTTISDETGTTAGAPGLLILTYNVCWQAMTNSCGNSPVCDVDMCRNCPPVATDAKLTRCALNTAHCIDALPERLGHPGYAFVGLQEASRFWKLQEYAPRTLGRMEVAHGRSAHETIACFYDGDTFALAHQPVESRFSHGRPFQILVCAEKAGSGGVIFVNIHNGHGAQHDMRYLADHLGPAIAALPLSPAEKAYRIVVTGDFNEAGWDWHSGTLTTPRWKPFESAGIDTSVSISATPPFSCCQSDGDWRAPGGGIARGQRAGDYVFDSAATADVQIPPSYDPSYTQSDHLPVMAVLV
ncbi:MAG: hypothetical protein AAF371_12085 [Pseudomonadota bacterium]